jgi:hypothetical protein
MGVLIRSAATVAVLAVLPTSTFANNATAAPDRSTIRATENVLSTIDIDCPDSMVWDGTRCVPIIHW